MPLPAVPMGTPGSSTVERTESPRSRSSWSGSGVASEWAFQVGIRPPLCLMPALQPKTRRRRRPQPDCNARPQQGSGCATSPDTLPPLMKSTVEPIDADENSEGRTLVKLSVEVDEAEFDRDIDAAFRKIAREVRIPGFRPGKAPRRILEARIGTAPAREQALRDAIPQYLARAVREHDVDIIA